MTSTAPTYQSSLTAALAREHIDDLLRDAHSAQAAAALPGRARHRTPRRRPLWWDAITTRSATPRAA